MLTMYLSLTGNQQPLFAEFFLQEYRDEESAGLALPSGGGSVLFLVNYVICLNYLEEAFFLLLPHILVSILPYTPFHCLCINLRQKSMLGHQVILSTGHM